MNDLAKRLLAACRPFTVAEFKASASDDSDYRRGYAHGYAQALQDMRATMERGGYTRPREAWNILARFHDRVLMPWRRDREYRHQPPPLYRLPIAWRVAREQVFERDGWACTQCLSPVELECDHIREVRNGGLPDMDNLRTLCGPCHRARKASQ